MEEMKTTTETIIEIANKISKEVALIQYRL
jgi:hypothetical protein